jgi:hypothetical protein
MKLPLQRLLIHDPTLENQKNYVTPSHLIQGIICKHDTSMYIKLHNYLRQVAKDNSSQKTPCGFLVASLHNNNCIPFTNEGELFVHYIG